MMGSSKLITRGGLLGEAKKKVTTPGGEHEEVLSRGMAAHGLV